MGTGFLIRLDCFSNYWINIDMSKRWYVVQARSGYARKWQLMPLGTVLSCTICRSQFGDILVPTEEVIEMRGGQKVKVRAQVFSGLRTSPNGLVG